MSSLSQADHAGSPPPYESKNNLRPTTTESVTAQRYNKPPGASRIHTRIPLGPPKRLADTSLPPQWEAYIHPEGQLYFVRHAPLVIVTEAYLHNPEVMKRIAGFAKEAELLLSAMNFETRDTLELLLQLKDGEDVCYYYFVDHETRTQFWIHDISTQDLNLYPVTATSHLKLSLQELYWSHVEYFPMHINLSKRSIEELIGVLIHAWGDHMTSSNSTFPYNASECADFLDLLRRSRDDEPNGYTTCIVGRLWSNVSNYRFINHHGQELTRLSRDQAIFVRSAAESSRIPGFWSKWLLGAPDQYLSRFDTVFVDEFLHAHDWRRFMAIAHQDWRISIAFSFLYLLSSMLFLIPLRSLHRFSLCTILTSMASIVSGIILSIRHENLREAGSAEGVSYLLSVQSRTRGFYPIALAFSLPRAMCIWSGISFLCQVLFIVLDVLGAPSALFAVSFLALFTLCIAYTLRPTSANAWPGASWYCPLSCIMPRRSAAAKSDCPV